ncbi:MAG TPA: acylphosphatase [Actinomycetota bacterium]|nr:acylphosphatase [Actinomycetota bacterium]
MSGVSKGRVRAVVSVSGRVQGVFFRQETARAARRAGVAGWVRNLPDGRVEAAFEGGRSEVDAMVRWVHNGPPLAAVEEVHVDWEEPVGESGFAIRA